MLYNKYVQIVTNRYKLSYLFMRMIYPQTVDITPAAVQDDNFQG